MADPVDGAINEAPYTFEWGTSATDGISILLQFLWGEQVCVVEVKEMFPGGVNENHHPVHDFGDGGSCTIVLEGEFI
jgi:hypothetical protein